MPRLFELAGVNKYSEHESSERLLSGAVKRDAVLALMDSGAFERWLLGSKHIQADVAPASNFAMTIGLTSLSVDDKSAILSEVLKRAEVIIGKEALSEILSRNHKDMKISPIGQAFGNIGHHRNFVAIANCVDQSTIDNMLKEASKRPVPEAYAENVLYKVQALLKRASLDAKTDVLQQVAVDPSPTIVGEFLKESLGGERLAIGQHTAVETGRPGMRREL